MALKLFLAQRTSYWFALFTYGSIQLVSNNVPLIPVSVSKVDLDLQRSPKAHIFVRPRVGGL